MENFKTDFEKSLKNNNLSEKEIAFKNFNAKEFSSHGFPNRKDEDWKFSDINQIIKKEILKTLTIKQFIKTYLLTFLFLLDMHIIFGNSLILPGTSI